MPEDELLEALTEVLDSLEPDTETTEATEQSKIRTKMKNLQKIFAIDVSAGPTDPRWSERIIEELKAFRTMKNTEYGDLIPHFRHLTPYEKKDQFLLVQYKTMKREWTWALIRLPIFYPKLPPNSIHSRKGNLTIYTKHTDPDKCLGGLVADRWDKKGKMGIAHWLTFCEVYIRLREKPVIL